MTVRMNENNREEAAVKKTKEELDSLKKELEDLSAKVQDLDENELKEVTGGSGGEATRKIGGYNFSGHVPAENVVRGRDYYFTIDGEDKWYRGTVLEIKKESYYIVLTRRLFLIRLTDVNGYGASGTWQIASNEATAYTNMVRTWY